MCASLLISLLPIPALAATPLEFSPGQEPQLTSDSQSIYLTFANHDQILFSSSPATDHPFSPPAPVATLPHLMLGMHRGPHIAVASDHTLLISAISSADGNLLSFRSTDAGQTWSSPTKINDVDHAAREGLHSLAAGPDRHLYAVWLDLRTGKTRIQGALSRDAGLTWEPNDIIYESPDSHTCECCQPSALFLPTGQIAILFRNFLDSNRDMYLATFSPGAASTTGVKIQKLDSPSWPLNSCPMDGGSLSLDLTTQSPVATFQIAGSLYRASPNYPTLPLGPGVQPSSANSATLYTSARVGPLLFSPSPQSPPIQLAPRATNPTLISFNTHLFTAYSADNKIYLLPLQ